MFRGVLVAVLCVLAACGDNATIEPDRDAAPLPPTPMLDAPATVTIVEGERRTFVVKLVEDPLEDVTITVTSRDPSVAVVDTASITLTSATYATGVEVAVRGVEDDADVINEPVELLLAIDDVVQARIPATVMDNDIQQVVFDTTSLTIAEAATGTFTVRLARLPETSVTVLLDSSAPTVATAAPAMLKFAPADYATPQTVTVTALADADTASHNVSIAARGASIVEPQAVAVAVTDDDVQALVLSAVDLPMLEGETTSFTVALAFDPVTPLTLLLDTSDSSALQVASPSVTFDSTNYSVPQTVTLTAPEDGDRLHEATTVTLSGALTRTLTAPVTDNDDILVTGDTTIAEGTTGRLRVSLANDPGPTGRTVALEVVGGDVSLATETLTFTSANYMSAQEVMVSAALDPVETNTSAVVRVSYPGNPQDVALTILHRVGTLSGLSFGHEWSNAGGVGWFDVSFDVGTTWPGDGRLVITFPPGYDASAATLLSSDVDGSLAVVTATTSTVTLVRANGTTLYGGTRKSVRLSNIRNPGVSGDYPITLETQMTGGSRLDRGTGTERIYFAALAGANVTLATLAPAATGSVTVAFTTRNPWPADGVLEVDLYDFDVANATVEAQTGLDGALAASSPAPGRLRLTRAGGTVLAGGSTVSIVVGNITNPPTSRVTVDFSILTASATGAGIDVAVLPGITIGCPSTLSKIAHAGRNVPFGGDAWACPECATDYVGPQDARIDPLEEASDFLVLDDFQLSVPAGATIAGIGFEVVHQSIGWPVVDSAVRAVASTIGTADRSLAAHWLYGGAVSYGGPTDLWGRSWSAADIESPSFGIALAARAATPGMAGRVAVRWVTATVYLNCPP